MKTLILNTSDINGGAAKAAYSLHRGLQHLGTDSTLLVQKKSSCDRTVILPRSGFLSSTRSALDPLPLKLHPQRPGNLFSPQWAPDPLAAQIADHQPDLINLHWVNAGFLQIESLAKFQSPIVWTLHDMWMFTGGCHYTQGCDRYIQSCGQCPQLSSTRNYDLSRWIWQRKANAWRHLSLTVVTPSRWLAQVAATSPLLHNTRIEVIPNGLDTQIYRPIAKHTARELLNLPQNKHLILFGSINAARDKRKGAHLLQAALQSLRLAIPADQLELVIFGAMPPADPVDFGFPTHYLGRWSDDLSLALIYSAADVFVLPSTQDNLPNTIMESLSCGVPCVGFNIGGIPDMVDHQINGYLAQPFDVSDLAQGILWTLESTDRYAQLSQQARAKVEQEFTAVQQAHRYHTLFQELLSRRA
jgi:glycosyltransferase involved in cell wall biosynthesis